MGSVVVGSLPDVLRNARCRAFPNGLPVELWPGYETRSRSTGGFEQLLGIGQHHDGITAGVPEINRSRSGWDRESNPNRPVGNVRIERNDGTWVIGSLMATNTQGRGPRLQMSKGAIPENQANLYMISWEPSNDGVGELWPDIQCESILTGSAAACNAYDLAPGDNLAHFETAPGRKGDPAGPCMFNGYTNRPWDMHLFRRMVAERMVELANYPGDDEMKPEQFDKLMRRLDAMDKRTSKIGGRVSRIDKRVGLLRSRANANHIANRVHGGVLNEIKQAVEAIRAKLNGTTAS